MFNFIKNFRDDEEGAVTVDWVVLTAAVVGLAVAAVATIRTNIDNAATRIGSEITSETTYTQ